MQDFLSFFRFFLVNQKKSSIFAASIKTGRDGGIGRHPRLKILCPAMDVPVRPRLAVRRLFDPIGQRAFFLNNIPIPKLIGQFLFHGEPQRLDRYYQPVCPKDCKWMYYL